MSHAPVKPGDVVAGKYQVERVLGAGGMGVVVAAMHQQLHERVAIKFLLAEVAQHPGAVERFQREARAAVRIKSEHVARVFDVDMLEDGVPYMVVEFLEGVDLTHRLEKVGSLPPEEAVEYVLQACEAMAEAHTLGIVHRDLKPSNLFLTRRANGEPLIKVLDFGISKMAPAPEDAPRPSLTSTTGVFGSPMYMSPEQARSAKNVDARTDIWSLGVVLYELLSGRAPFEGTMVPEVVAKIAADPPLPLRDSVPDLDPRLEQIVLRCLEKSPSHRYQNVAELASDLVPFGGPRAMISMHRITANPPASLPPPAVSGSGAWSDVRLGSDETLDGTSTRARTKRAGLAIAVAVGAACLALGVLVVALRSTDAPSEQPGPVPPPPPISSASALPAATASATDVPSSSAALSATAAAAAPAASIPAQPAKPLPAKTTPQATTAPKPTVPSTAPGIQDLINDRR